MLVTTVTAASVPHQEAEDLEVVQEIVGDLDGDGQLDRLYSVVVMVPERRRYAFTFSGLLWIGGRVQPGSAPAEESQARLLLRDDAAAVVLRAVLDLDRDGKIELWVQHFPAADKDLVQQILVMEGGRAVRVGRFECLGPQ